jgi:hypothetical protein
MPLDLIELRDRYARLDTDELLRLSESGGLVPEVQRLIDEELAHRPDREAVVASRRSAEVAVAELAEGTRRADVQDNPIRMGATPGAAAEMARAAEAAVGDARRRSIIGTIASGVALVAVGIAVTAFTHAGAGSTGGYYVVWWGAVVAGAIQVIRGVWALAKHWRAERSRRSV